MLIIISYNEIVFLFPFTNTHMDEGNGKESLIRACMNFSYHQLNKINNQQKKNLLI